MNRFALTVLTAVTIGWGLTGCQSADPAMTRSILNALGGQGRGQLDSGTIVAGLKEALRIGTQNAVRTTSREGGYLENPAIRIPLPERLQGMSDALRKAGFGAQVDRLERRMNLAAEKAAAEAAPVFADALGDMTIADARGILRGGETAATEYFRDNTYSSLKERYMPIVSRQMEQLGLVRLYNDLQTRYNRIPFVPDVSVTLDDYVAEEALDGLFHMLAREETKIRENPAARTTDLLRRVFGNR